MARAPGVKPRWREERPRRRRLRGAGGLRGDGGVLLLLRQGQPARLAHPGPGPDLPEPVGQGGDPAQVLLDVLLPDPADGDDLAVGVGQGRPEHLLGPEDALGVVPQGAVPEVGPERLGGVEELVDPEVVLGPAAPALGAAEAVVPGMSDMSPLYPCAGPPGASGAWRPA